MRNLKNETVEFIWNFSIPLGVSAVPVGLYELGSDTMMPMPSGKQQESGPFARALSAEIRATLARKRVTVKELARRSNLSESYLGKRLRDLSPLTLNDTEAICSALGEDLVTFITTAAQASKGLNPKRNE